MTALMSRQGSTALERARAEALLVRYPQLKDAEIRELQYWFRRRASAADVALLACNESLYPNYRAFSRRFLDPFSWWQIVIMAVLAALPIALLGAALVGDA